MQYDIISKWFKKVIAHFAFVLCETNFVELDEEVEVDVNDVDIVVVVERNQVVFPKRIFRI